MLRNVLTAVLPAVFVALPASAAVIEFSALPGANADTLGTYNEDGFTVTNLSNFKVAAFFGKPARSIFALGQMNSGGGAGAGSFRLTATGGEAFFLHGFDLAAGNNPPSTATPDLEWEISGSLNGNAVFDLASTSNGSSFLTIDPGFDALVVDTVIFSFIGREVSYNVDNIEVSIAPPPTDVPAPGALPLLGFGLTALGAVAWRGRRGKARG